jgi:hypothetical protein
MHKSYFHWLLCPVSSFNWQVIFPLYRRSIYFILDVLLDACKDNNLAVNTVKTKYIDEGRR